MFLKDLNTSEKCVFQQVTAASSSISQVYCLGVMNGLIGSSAASVTQNVSSERAATGANSPV